MHGYLHDPSQYTCSSTSPSLSTRRQSSACLLDIYQYIYDDTSSFAVCINTFSDALSEDLNTVTEDKLNLFCRDDCPAIIERVSAKLAKDCAEVRQGHEESSLCLCLCVEKIESASIGREGGGEV